MNAKYWAPILKYIVNWKIARIQTTLKNGKQILFVMQSIYIFIYICVCVCVSFYVGLADEKHILWAHTHALEHIVCMCACVCVSV